MHTILQAQHRITYEEALNFSRDSLRFRLQVLKNVEGPNFLQCRTESPDANMWIEIGPEQYRELLEYCFNLNHASRGADNVFLKPEDIRKYNLNADLDSLMKHIGIMRKALRRLFKFPQISERFPPNTSLSFLDSLCLVHDFSRFVFNGPLRYTDVVSDILVNGLLPGFPLERFLHTIRWNTGEKEFPLDEVGGDLVDEIYFIPLIMKTLDTLGKPGVSFLKLYEKDGIYFNWLSRQISLGRFPIRIPSFSNMIQQEVVSAEEYMARDIKLTQKGVELIESIINYPIDNLFD